MILLKSSAGSHRRLLHTLKMEVDLQKEWDEIENEVDPKYLQALLWQFNVTIE